MRSSRLAALLIVAGAVAACAGGDQPFAGPVIRLAVDGRANDNVSATARGNAVAVAWSGTAHDTTDVFVAVSRDGGASFGPAQRVNTVPGDARVGGEQPPRVALVADPGGIAQPVVVWTRKDPAGTRIVWSATNAGAAFSPAANVPGADGVGNRGWESVAVGEGDRPLALWLDHRETAGAAVAPMHHHEGAAANGKVAPDMPKPDPVERAGLSRVWFASLDGAVPPRSITGGVCYCCKTALAASGERVVAAWRQVFAGNQRDIAFAQSTDGGRTFSSPVRVSADQWKFDGCPENGPAVAIGRDGAVHVAWVTPRGGIEGAPLALYTASTLDGTAFSPRAQVPTPGAVAHLQLVAERGGGLVLAWDEATPAGRVVRVSRGAARGDGRATFGRPLTMPGTGDHPALAAADSGTALAWVRKDAGASFVQLVRVP